MLPNNTRKNRNNGRIEQLSITLKHYLGNETIIFRDGTIPYNFGKILVLYTESRKHWECYTWYLSSKGDRNNARGDRNTNRKKKRKYSEEIHHDTECYDEEGKISPPVGFTEEVFVLVNNPPS